MPESILKCAECGLFCDASGVPLPVRTAARAIELIAMEREGRVTATTCALCKEGQHRPAAELKAEQERVVSAREDGFRQLPPGDRE